MNPFRPDNAQRAPGANRGLILTLLSCTVLVMAVACGTTNSTTTAPRSEGTRAAEVSVPTAEVSAPAPTEAPPAVTPEYARLAAPDATEAATEAPAQVAAPATDPDAAPCAPGQIKGNDRSHIFHAPGQRDYAKTRATVTCFDTAAQAIAAGYRAAKR